MRNITPSRTEQICLQYFESAYDLLGAGGIGYRLYTTNPEMVQSLNKSLPRSRQRESVLGLRN